VLEKSGERVEIMHEAHEFLEIFQTCLRLRALVRLPHGRIAAFVQNLLGKVGVAHGVELPAPALELAQQIVKRLSGLAGQFVGFNHLTRGGVKRYGARARQLVNALDGRIAESALGHVDDALELQVV
jgi:hypothetical protein